MLHVPANAANRAHHVFDDIRASERSSQLVRQTEACDREYLLEPLEQTAGYARCIAFQALRKVANQPLGFASIIEFPSLA